MQRLFVVILTVILLIPSCHAKDHVLDLNVEYKIVNFSGKSVKAKSINGQIPAPTLRFKQGDRVTINVHNKLDEETSIHWHGIIIPWQMDGVTGVTQAGIKPGSVFKYQFTLQQAGTYWYHAHAALQEQEGLYGALIIDPLQSAAYSYDKDFAVVLSDWSDTPAEQILANLKKDGDYYSPNFPLQASLTKFLHDYSAANTIERKQIIDDYKMMQQMRMGLYDFSDVAYDAFLLNGSYKNKPWTALVKVGDTVRLRFVGAAASTIFKVKIPGTKLQIVHVQGNDVQPYLVDDFTIAPGETYDVLVKIEKQQPSIIYAESLDTSGVAYGVLITDPKQKVDYAQVIPFAPPSTVTNEMMSLMMDTMPMSMDMSGGSMSMDMPTEASIIGDKLSTPEASYTTSASIKYAPLKAVEKTNDPNMPIHAEIKMELFGYMGRYIWFINGVPEHQAKPIIFDSGKRYRIVFTNNSMMHHPMHIHGHWFILRKGYAEYDPLLHTIDVAPGATITADIDADASGQWLFHCHMLYHMFSGMARVFQYSNLMALAHGHGTPQKVDQQSAYVNRPIIKIDELKPIDSSLVMHHMAHATSLYKANFLELAADPFHNAQTLNFVGLYGTDYNKLQLYVNDAELRKGSVADADVDAFYWHVLSQFWAIKGGINYFYRPASRPYLQLGVGIEGLMPYFIDTNIRAYYHNGALKLDLELERDSQITNNFFVRLGARTILASKTVQKDQVGSGLNKMRYMLRPYYQIAPGVNIFAEYEYKKNYGSFNNLQTIAGEPKTENTVSFGFAWLF